MSNCKHPKGFISNIGHYKICNLCGEKFYAKAEPEAEKPVVAKIEEKPAPEAEPPKAEIKPVEEPKVEVVEEPIEAKNDEPKAKKPRKKKNIKK